MADKVSFKGFRNLLRKYDEDGRYVKSGDWAMGRGAYDQIWFINYKGIQVLDGVQGVWSNNVKVENCTLSENDFKKAFRIISEEYGPDFKIHPDTLAMFKKNHDSGLSL